MQAYLPSQEKNGYLPRADVFYSPKIDLLGKKDLGLAYLLQDNILEKNGYLGGESYLPKPSYPAPAIEETNPVSNPGTSFC